MTPKRRKKGRRVRKDTGFVNATPKRPEKKRRIPHETIQSTIEDLPVSLPDLESSNSGACQSFPRDDSGTTSSLSPQPGSQTFDSRSSSMVSCISL